MSKRCGSYPLMNLAADYGVAYADVLIWAEYLRRVRVEGFSPALHGLQGLAMDGYERIAGLIGVADRSKLVSAMVAHANARWGRL